nr:PREDICTED: protein PAT1 homolog 2-like [Lepisosteus oculatus]
MILASLQTQLDLESGSDEGDPTDLLLFCGHPEPLPASAPAFSEVTPRVQPASRPGGRRPVFDDPAVVRTVEGRPSLQSLDSAIVDSSVSSAWGSLDPDSPDTPLWLLSPQETPHSSQSSILQDKAIIRVIDRPSPARIPPTTLDFLSPAPRCFTAGSPSVKRGPPSRGSPQSYGPRYLSQVRCGVALGRGGGVCVCVFVHIEGSLGQVAVSTCFSPRRAIDAVHAHTSEEEQKDTRQQRLSVLHSIEQMYMMLLEVEEGERKAALFSEEERQRLRDKRTLRVQKICGRLQRPLSVESRDEFLPYLLVAKGKRLVARLLPFLSHESALQILTAVTTHLPVLMARDTPGVDEVQCPVSVCVY